MVEITPQQIADLVGTSPTILEIGCNDGTDTLKFLEAMPGACIYCFDPDPRAIARFYERVGQVDHVTLEVCAVADVDGVARFHGSSGKPPNVKPSSPHYCHLDEWDLSGSLYEPTGHLDYSKWCTFPADRQYQVRVIRLDSYWKGRSPVDFIWMDVQGAEASVILGASQTLTITKYIYLEYYDRPLYAGQVSLDTLKSMLSGFDFVGKYGDNALFRNKTR